MESSSLHKIDKVGRIHSLAIGKRSSYPIPPTPTVNKTVERHHIWISPCRYSLARGTSFAPINGWATNRFPLLCKLLAKISPNNAMRRSLYGRLVNLGTPARGLSSFRQSRAKTLVNSADYNTYTGQLKFADPGINYDPARNGFT